MYMKRLIAPAIAMTAVALWVQNASAADITPEPSYVAPPAAPLPEVWSWTGFHVGLDVGGQFDSVESDALAHNVNSYWENFFDNYQDIEASAKLGAANWFISADVGADYQVPNSRFVFGVFANYDFAPSDSSATHNADDFANCAGSYNDCNLPGSYYSPIGATTTYEKYVDNTVTYGDAWGIGLRGGVLVNPKALFYVLGGFGQKQITAQSNYYYDYYNGETFDGYLNGGGWRPGWFVGAGIEAAVGKHTTLALEYRFAKYKGFSASCDIDTGPSCVGSDPSDFEFNHAEFTVGNTNSHTIRARLSYWLN